MAKKNEKNSVSNENKEPEEKLNEAQQTADEVAQCSECDKLSAELETLKAQLEQEKDRSLRLAAEYDNFRRRTQKEKEGHTAMRKRRPLRSFCRCLTILSVPRRTPKPRLRIIQRACL